MAGPGLDDADLVPAAAAVAARRVHGAQGAATRANATLGRTAAAAFVLAKYETDSCGEGTSGARRHRAAAAELRLRRGRPVRAPSLLVDPVRPCRSFARSLSFPRRVLGPSPRVGRVRYAAADAAAAGVARFPVAAVTAAAADESSPGGGRRRRQRRRRQVAPICRRLTRQRPLQGNISRGHSTCLTSQGLSQETVRDCPVRLYPLFPNP